MEAEYNAARYQWYRDHKIDMVVDAEDICALIAQWTGIPVSRMLEGEAERLLHMEERLHERIIGQDEAIQAVSEAVRRRPCRVILFDEIEKAHPDVFNILLQILEDGRLTDGHGRSVDFRNTLVIMTSNLGTGDVGRQQGIGFRREGGLVTERERLRASIEEALKKTFRPELLNRIYEIIIFDPLTREQIKWIVDLLVADVQRRLEELHSKIELTDGARERLAQEGFDPVFGARPLRRAVQRYVENPLSNRILAGEIGEGETVLGEVTPDGLVFSRVEDTKSVSV